MALRFASLNSGSNGNCYYIGNDHEAILVDAGISCRETEKRMRRLGLSPDKLKAVFVSHEHSDHIRGLDVLAKKYQLPVYITPGTLRNSGLKADYPVLGFQAFSKVLIGSLQVIPFPKLHDAADPHSFVVESGGLKVGVFTDIGSACDNVIRYFKECHAVFLEANYCEQMLEAGRYPYHLKRRIRGGHGHLSNSQALQLFTSHRPAFLNYLFLSHLSKDNNCPQLVHRLFSEQAGDTEIVVASRFEETAVYEICTAQNQIVRSFLPEVSERQLSLF